MSGRAATINVISGAYALSVGRSDMPAPKGWRWVTLTDLARLESGHTPSREHSEYWDGGIPWIGIKDARLHHGGKIAQTLQTVTQAGLDNSAARLLPAGTVCLSRTASIGYVVVTDREMATSQDFVNWVCGPELDPSFLQQLLIAENESLFRFGKGSTHTTIYYPEVKAFHVCLPPLNEQRRIVAKLEALQAHSRRARDALDAVPPLLEKLRQSILAAAFRGDLTKDWRDAQKNIEPGTELLKRIRAQRRTQWEESEVAKMRAKGKPPTDDRWKAKYKDPEPVHQAELSLLPVGWAWASVELVGDVLLGRRRSAEEYVEGKDGRVLRPYVRVANVKEDRLVLEDVLQMPFNEQERALYTLIPGDIVLSEGQSPELVGQSGIFRGGFDDLCIQATVHRFRASPFATTSDFAQLVFLNHLHSGYFKSAASLTTNIAHLTSERLKPLRFPLPSLAEQAVIVERTRRALERLDLLVERAAAVQRQHTALNSSLLAKAFSGELVPHDSNDESSVAVLKRSTERDSPVQTSEASASRGRRRSVARAEQTND